MSSEPRLIQDMSFAEYLADPAPEPSITSGILRDLLGSTPQRVWHRTPRVNPEAVIEQKKTFDLGSAAHAMFVGKGADLAVVDADSWRTNAAKSLRGEAYAAGRTPILVQDYTEAEAMAAAAELQFSQNPNIQEVYPSADREATIIWQELGVMHRCRPDFYHAAKGVIIHYKTTATTLSAASLPRYAASLGWDVTAAHYGAGATMLTGEVPRQYFAVQENKAPYVAMVVELDDLFVACGAMIRELAIGLWATCLREDRWPGHPVETLTLECPGWHESVMTMWKDAAVAALDGEGARRFRLTPTPTRGD